MSNTPAQLWLGHPDTLATQLQDFLQRTLCKKNYCQVCSDCRAIREHQHHSVIWINPEGAYTLEDIQIIFSTIAFALADDQQLFFILHKADLLTPICANSLLKSLEEPPPGYHFILLAQRSEHILPTIRSRCTIRTFYETTAPSTHPLLPFFCTTTPADAFAFTQELDAQVPSEQDSIDLADAIFAFWTEQSKQALLTANTTAYNHAQKHITLLKKMLTNPPMPGSSKLFWRTLFLSSF